MCAVVRQLETKFEKKKTKFLLCEYTTRDDDDDAWDGAVR
jgi:hypothetical protein